MEKINAPGDLGKAFDQSKEIPSATPVVQSGNFKNVDALLASIISELDGSVIPEKYEGGFYKIVNGGRVSKSFTQSKEHLLLIANHLKFMLEPTDLPDQVLLVAASWFVTHLNLLEEIPVYGNTFAKSMLFYINNPRKTVFVKRLYWALRDLYFPNQSCGEGGITTYDTQAELFDRREGWTKLHVVSLTNLEERAAWDMMKAIVRQRNNLFIQKWPLLVIADPCQKPTFPIDLFTVIL